MVNREIKVLVDVIYLLTSDKLLVMFACHQPVLI